ncbi:hypothetical protein LPJ61_006931 [Coemansia biformis]|uniref:Uncharacterized protein n=1 Tax=Coemansia biformis TaxID=1286918 RepID=A0A9W7XT60_9FUNG|nr:hypothetical protein LPJ61_006931 [Coemansia biformis]
MEAPPAKRARHSDMAITVNSNYLGLQHLGHSFAQHQHPGSGGHGDFLLSSEIAQLASGMRFDSASNQEVTASLSAQSGHTIPAQSLVGVAAPDPLRVGANHPGYLRHDEPALVPASFALPTSADGSAYAAAMAAAVAAARTSMPQSQYAALGALNVPSLPAAPQAYAVPHMDHGPPLGPRMAEMQHPLPTMASASSSAIAGSIPPQPSDCQAHYGPVSGSSRR